MTLRVVLGGVLYALLLRPRLLTLLPLTAGGHKFNSRYRSVGRGDARCHRTRRRIRALRHALSLPAEINKSFDANYALSLLLRVTRIYFDFDVSRNR